MTFLDMAVCLCVSLGMTSAEPSDAQVRQFLSNSYYYSTQEWQASLSSMNEKFASKQRFAERLVGFLNDDDTHVRQGVLLAIIELKANKASLISPVVRVLKEDKDIQARIYAVDALHSIAGKESLKHVLSALNDKNANVRAEALQVFGREASSSTAYVGKLRDMLSDDGEYSYSISADCFGARPVKYEAVVALGTIGPEARICLPELREMYANDSDPSVRIAAAVAVAQLDKEDVKAIRYLKNEAERATSDDYRYGAIVGLQRFGNRASIIAPILKKLLKSDPSWLIRAGCSDALPAVNGFVEDTVGALVEALDDREPFVQMSVLESLKAIGFHAAKAVPAVEKLLDKYSKMPEEDLPYGGDDIRVQIVATLLAVGKRESVEPIVHRILRRVKDEETRSDIQELLSRPSQKLSNAPVANKPKT